MSRKMAAAVFLLTAAVACAERLPIRLYSTAEGLASTNLNCTVRDSHGFLWAGPDGAMWFTDGSKIGRLALPPGLPAAVGSQPSAGTGSAPTFTFQFPIRAAGSLSGCWTW